AAKPSGPLTADENLAPSHPLQAGRLRSSHSPPAGKAPAARLLSRVEPRPYTPSAQRLSYLLTVAIRTITRPLSPSVVVPTTTFSPSRTVTGVLKPVGS